ncbi:MAG: nucleotidyl transferase AbiEii/AbiGii toxin family protein [Parcubacteria group bacterium]|nr:nucleotidyl transferase AbiEii/AbiGii toxin family protein [Parcubacteria group bacterium]
MHPEALNEEGKKLLPFFKGFQNFYLAGGTALALQIGHRISVDFDFFSPKEISEDLLKGLKKTFAGYQITVSVNNLEELTVFFNGIKVTFVKYPFPVIKPFLEYEGLKLLNVEEIGATKAYVIGRRGDFKDYVDLYYILSENHSSLDKIINLAEIKYQNEFNSRLFLEQLIFLEDIEEPKLIFLKKQITKKELEKFFSGTVKSIRL